MNFGDSFLWDSIFGAIGAGYFVYGKNQGNITMLVIGSLLCIYPFFVSSPLWTLLIGAGLTLAPLVLNKNRQ